jgi:hypothetical protein
VSEIEGKKFVQHEDGVGNESQAYRRVRHHQVRAETQGCS